MDEFGPRARRAVTLMAVALVALVVAAGVYLRASAPRPAPSGPSPLPEQVLADVVWQSAAEGWVVVGDRPTRRSILYHTTDAGRHWDRQFATVGPISLHFFDARHGVLQELPQPPAEISAVLRTDDGGAHWSPIPLPADSGYKPGTPFFVDPEHGWVLAPESRGPFVQDVVLYATANAGADWTEELHVDQAQPVSHGITDTGVKDAMTFQTLTDGSIESVEPDGSAAVYVTHDGGREWRKLPLPRPPSGWPAPNVLRVEAPQIDRGHGELALLVSSPSRSNFSTLIVYVTADGGDTWQDPVAAPSETASYAAAQGVLMWAAGPGHTWVSADAGRTWQPRPGLASNLTIVRFSPVDDMVALAEAVPNASSGRGWRLLLTYDGARTWRDVPIPPAA
jgi:photosystem II stability/assembly factor-like uncharacterized protein